MLDFSYHQSQHDNYWHNIATMPRIDTSDHEQRECGNIECEAEDSGFFPTEADFIAAKVPTIYREQLMKAMTERIYAMRDQRGDYAGEYYD